MNSGYMVAILGIVVLIAGAGLYATNPHLRWLGTVGVGIILVLIGFWMSRRPMTSKPMGAQPQATPAK